MKYEYIGLNAQQVAESRKQYRTNILPPPEIEGFWNKMLKKIKDPKDFKLYIDTYIPRLL